MFDKIQIIRHNYPGLQSRSKVTAVFIFRDVMTIDTERYASISSAVFVLALIVVNLSGIS